MEQIPRDGGAPAITVDYRDGTSHAAQKADGQAVADFDPILDQLMAMTQHVIAGDIANAAVTAERP